MTRKQPDKSKRSDWILYHLLGQSDGRIGIDFSGWPVSSWQCIYCEVIVYEDDDTLVSGLDFPHDDVCILKRAWEWMEE